mmetsp:Transcript_44647/g.93426  ORF Transcript_44647/g.93426 Transcript_44647/m.93426 type:complete len:125 (-) Transcript_44647:396-770(-)
MFFFWELNNKPTPLTPPLNPHIFNRRQWPKAQSCIFPLELPYLFSLLLFPFLAFRSQSALILVLSSSTVVCWKSCSETSAWSESNPIGIWRAVSGGLELVYGSLKGLNDVQRKPSVTTISICNS